jgi:hypothetical protein
MHYLKLFISCDKIANYGNGNLVHLKKKKIESPCFTKLTATLSHEMAPLRGEELLLKQIFLHILAIIILSNCKRIVFKVDHYYRLARLGHKNSRTSMNFQIFLIITFLKKYIGDETVYLIIVHQSKSCLFPLFSFFQPFNNNHEQIANKSATICRKLTKNV